MSKRLSTSIRSLLLALILLLALTAGVQAQATRTWVSGVGDDANPCSRTAPCKTFAGAISKTATGGEINVLDPGGFGGVTITKSITISSEGFEAGVLVSGTNAIIINATTTSTVVLRGLDIEGLGTGLVGIKVLGGLGALHVEKCTINAFRGTNGSGIEIAPTTAGTTRVFIKDTIVRNNGQGTGGGVFLNPGAGVTVETSIDGVRMENNTFGFKAGGSGTTDTSISDSVAASNSGDGFAADAPGTAILNLSNIVATNNGTGLRCNNDFLRIGSSTVVGNTTTAVIVGANCFSWKNNNMDAVVPLTQIGLQ